MSPFQRFGHGGATFRTFDGTFARRIPGPLGCLFVIVACPIGLLVGAVLFLLSLLPSARRRQAAAFRPATTEAGARDEALRRLVRAMALDDTFSADEARQAGTLVAGGATIDDLLADAVERGWVEVRGERLAVTRRGRDETDGSSG